jgi:lipoprotein-releasing system permease protein
MAAFGSFERMLAFRYLRARRQEGFVSVIAGFSFLGIALGVATLIIVMSVMNGFRQELLDRVLGLEGHARVEAAAGALADFDAVAGRLRAINGVKSASPVIDGEAMATANGIAAGARVRGMRAGDLAQGPLAGRSVRGGSLDGMDEDGIVVGIALAQMLHLQIGDRLSLVLPVFDAKGVAGLPRTRAYRVAAVFAIGMYEYDSTYIFMPLEAAQDLFRLDDRVSAIEIMLKDPEAVPALRPLIAAAAGKGSRLSDWQQSNSSRFNAIQIERDVMFFILTLIILVATFNIVTGMIMLVKDKGHDIAIIRTMGATSASILRVFLMSGAAIGVIGTLAGLVLGLAVARNVEALGRLIERAAGSAAYSQEIYFLAHLPAIVDWRNVAAVAAMGLALSFLATLYPSWRAARLDPVEALRYE